MDKIKTAVEDANAFLSLVNLNSFKNFSVYSPVYRMTNENLREVVTNMNLENKDVLSVCGSADQYFTFLLCGAKEVDLFDVNKISEYYLILKIIGALTLSLDEYIKFFVGTNTGTYDDNRSFFDERIYVKIRKYLPLNVQAFWDTLYKNGGNIIKRFGGCFFSPHIKFSNIPYLNKSRYNELQKILEKRKIPSFIQSDILGLYGKVEKQYDMVYLSNIYDYVFRKDKVKSWYSFLREIEGMLKAEGTFVNYSFSSEELAEYKKLGMEVCVFETLRFIDEDIAFVYRKK